MESKLDDTMYDNIASELRREKKKFQKQKKVERQTFKTVLLLSGSIFLCVYFSFSREDGTLSEFLKQMFGHVMMYSAILGYPVFWVIKYNKNIIKSARFIFRLLIIIIIIIIIFYVYMWSYIPGPRPEIYQNYR